MNYAKGLIKYIEDSPSSFHAVRNAQRVIEQKDNFTKDGPKPGKCILSTMTCSDGATLVAIDIGEKAKKNGWPINVIAAHVDSPWLKVEFNDLMDSGQVLQLEARKYGGINYERWIDRPMTIAGRLALKSKKEPRTKLFHLKKHSFVMPGIATHFRKFADPSISLYPFAAESDSKIKTIKGLLANELDIKEDDILDFSVNTVCKEKPSIWGFNKEFLSAPRLDDLACVYTALTAFAGSHNPDAINVLYFADNEEIGSDTPVGAFSGFLADELKALAEKLNFDLKKALEKSFMLSADNAQACSPDYDYLYNPDHTVYMNKGLAAKQSERYASTDETIKIFGEICDKAKEPHQLYLNREDIPGGGTIGLIIQESLPIDAVDIGIPQLAMHSCYETIGTKDVKHAVAVFRYFYTKFRKKEG